MQTQNKVTHSYVFVQLALGTTLTRISDPKLTVIDLQAGDEAAGGAEVPDLAAIKARVREMEEEAEKLKQMQTEVDKQMSMGSPPGLSQCSLDIFLACSL